MEIQFLNPDHALELGIFANTFRRSSVDEVFDAVASYGLSCTQWNWACVRGMPNLPESVPPETVRSIVRAASRSGVRIAAVSAAFNILDHSARARGIARLPVLAESAIAVGCDLLTLCTGTRHATGMWTWHPDNSSPFAWSEMMEGLRQAGRIARQYGIRLGIEPAIGNVVSDAADAQRVLRELEPEGVPLSMILDAANLYQPSQDPRSHPEVIDDAIARLGEYISIAHAGDIAVAQSQAGLYSDVAVGTGMLAYRHYIAALLKAPLAGDGTKSGARLPLILQGLDESQVPTSVAFLRDSIRAVRAKEEDSQTGTTGRL